MRIVIYLVLLGFLTSCSCKTSVLVISDVSNYEKEHTIWKNNRIKSLSSKEGWLSVIGLHWLKEGNNSIGSRLDMDIKLPEFATSVVGDIVLEGDSIYFKSAGESYVILEDNRFVEGRMHSDAAPEPTKLIHKSLIFYIIKRGDKYGLRVKDQLASTRYKLKNIPSYDINYNYIFEADVEILDEDKFIQVENIIGITEDYKVESVLKFCMENKNYKLLAFDGGAESYFVIFKDNSSLSDTYGGGRFIYVKKPGVNQNTCIIDFNKAYNPPCAFTNYATCPLPPLENQLDFSVYAGEKNPEGH